MKNQTIIPNFWFNRNAQEAVDFYLKIFPDAKSTKTTYYGKEGFELHQMPEGTVLTIDFELYGERFVALNGGPEFPLNPAISMMILCDTEEEVDKFWKALGEGGNVLMPLDKYDWSKKYGWLSDRFGVSWQLYLGDEPHKGQKIIPQLMYTGAQNGKAEEAVHFYTSVFENSKIEGIMKYGPGPDEGHVMHSQFSIRDYTMAAMDSSEDHKFSFNEGVSLIVDCKDQKEVDKFWNALTADGGEESMCGWVKDKYGVSWQIIPLRLYELLEDKDKARASRAMEAMLQMRKLVIADLEAAADGKSAGSK